MFNLTYEFKLKPIATQVIIFEEWLEQCRKVYNYALRERKDWFKSRSCQINACSIRSEYIILAETKRPNYSSQCRGLTQARKSIPALKKVQVHVLQQTLRRVEKAFVSMWENSHGFPRFKKHGTMRSFVFPQLNKFVVKPGMVNLPKIGWIKIRQSREIPQGGEVKQARVVRRASGWYVMLTVQWKVDIPQALPHGEPLGIDVGISNFVATSTGKLVPNPRPFQSLERKLKLLQQRVSRKHRGSNNWKKSQYKVSKLHERIGNIRKNYHWELAHSLCDRTGMIFAEDLNLKGLAKGMLAKYCLDAGWGQFLNILSQYCLKRGVSFQKVDAKKTSQICPNCLIETGKKLLSERTHSCSNCGYTTDRDVAAAQVVAIRGLAAVGRAPRRVNYRLTKLNSVVKMLSEGKFTGIPEMKESPSF